MERRVHLAGIVDDLMEVSRITTGKIELRMEVVDLSSVAAGRRGESARRSRPEGTR